MIREMPSRDLTVPLAGPPPEGATLADYLALVWRARIFLAIATIAGGATMFVKSISGPRVYESTVTFAANQSKIGEGNQSMTVGSTASFRPIVESLSTAAVV